MSDAFIRLLGDVQELLHVHRGVLGLDGKLLHILEQFLFFCDKLLASQISAEDCL